MVTSLVQAEQSQVLLRVVGVGNGGGGVGEMFAGKATWEVQKVQGRTNWELWEVSLATNRPNCGGGVLGSTAGLGNTSPSYMLKPTNCPNKCQVVGVPTCGVWGTVGMSRVGGAGAMGRAGCSPVGWWWQWWGRQVSAGRQGTGGSHAWVGCWKPHSPV